MTEELITTLTKIEGLRVIAHRSVLQFKQTAQSVPEIARLLEVSYREPVAPTACGALLRRCSSC
jgi:TolB-like protein